MAEEKNIANYSAADIEKYWKGKLSPAEMHAMEKAAMDDPFFADALEGYQYASKADDDLKTLAGKINERTGTAAKVIPISTKQKKFNWLRVAAAIIIICGAGVLVQQLFFNSKNDLPISEVKKEEDKKSDVAATIPAEQKNQVTTPGTKIDSPKTILQNSPNLVTVPKADLSAAIEPENAEDKSEEKEIKKAADDVAVINKPAIAKKDTRENELLKEKAVTTDTTSDQFFSDKQSDIADKRAISETKLKSERVANGYDRVNSNAAGAVNTSGFTNKYNYRVVDAQNNPVPFANVMNTRDRVGTYTDIRGNFNLVSTDSILDVEIRSQGYLSNNYRLMPSTQTGALVLKEDEVAKRQITVQNRPMVTTVTRKDSTEIEEPEVGWGNYNVYVQNNIQVPEKIRGKKTSTDVELSFDIDKNGQPINIKVTKSSQCKECDEEAKRLLKEGPKWKRKGKRSKTTISIAIDQ